MTDPSPTTPLRLRGVQAKLQRALNHLLDFEKEIAFWLYHTQYEIRSELEADGTKLVARIQFTKEPPIEYWGVRVGDIAHNLRSALEHLTWQIVDANGGAVGRDVKFPIYRSESDYIGWRKATPRRRDPFTGVDAGAVKAIEAEQPYATEDGDPTQHPLFLLNETWNRDKHQIVTPVIFRYPIFPIPEEFLMLPIFRPGLPISCEGFEVEAGTQPEMSDTLMRFGKLEDGQHVATFTGRATAPHPKVHVHGDLTAEVCTEEGRIFTNWVRDLFIAVRDVSQRLGVWAAK